MASWIDSGAHHEGAAAGHALHELVRDLRQGQVKLAADPGGRRRVSRPQWLTWPTIANNLHRHANLRDRDRRSSRQSRCSCRWDLPAGRHVRARTSSITTTWAAAVHILRSDDNGRARGDVHGFEITGAGRVQQCPQHVALGGGTRPSVHVEWDFVVPAARGISVDTAALFTPDTLWMRSTVCSNVWRMRSLLLVFAGRQAHGKSQRRGRGRIPD